MEQRRKFSEAFKREAVGLTRQPGVSVSQVARVKKERDFLRDAAAFFAKESS